MMTYNLQPLDKRIELFVLSEKVINCHGTITNVLMEAVIDMINAMVRFDFCGVHLLSKSMLHSAFVQLPL